MKNKFYSNWSNRKLKNEHRYFTIPFLTKLPIEEGMDVLDIGGFGCGGLNTSIYFKEKGCVIDAMNIDDSVKGWCNDFDVHFIHADIFNYSNKEKKYDVIMSELEVETQIKMLKEGYVESLCDMLKPNGILLMHFTDDISKFPTGQKWEKRYNEMKPIVEEFKKDYCNNKPIEEILTTKYNVEYLGRDNGRIFMKWFKFSK